jgi:hypothetical protein
MLNTQEDTGDPLFMLQARQQGILEDDYIYMGARASFINYQRLNHVPAGGENKQFSYNVDYSHIRQDSKNYCWAALKTTF